MRTLRILCRVGKREGLLSSDWLYHIKTFQNTFWVTKYCWSAWSKSLQTHILTLWKISISKKHKRKGRNWEIVSLSAKTITSLMVSTVTEKSFVFICMACTPSCLCSGSSGGFIHSMAFAFSSPSQVLTCWSNAKKHPLFSTALISIVLSVERSHWCALQFKKNHVY